MFCPKCSKMNPDTELVCSGCGADLKTETTPAKKEKKGKAVKIIVSLLAVAVVVCIAVLLLNGCAKPTSEMSF